MILEKSTFEKSMSTFPLIPFTLPLLEYCQRLYFVAYSDKQCRKFFFDMCRNVIKKQCFLEYIDEVKRDSKIPYEVYQEELHQHFEGQQNKIYRKEKTDEKSENH